jgi:NADH dehydrogenase (ubiquinone) 1 alpha subcomplex subunit 8
MVITKDVTLPSEEELTVPVEIKLSGPALRAGAFHLGKYCENVNNVSLKYVSATVF